MFERSLEIEGWCWVMDAALGYMQWSDAIRWKVCDEIFWTRNRLEIDRGCCCEDDVKSKNLASYLKGDFMSC